MQHHNMSDAELIQEVISRVSAFDIRSSRGSYPEPNVQIKIKRAAILLPVTVKDGEVLILLTKRSKHLRSHPSTVSFPGGMRDETDSSDIDAALREAEEEIGLPPSAVKVLGILTLGVTLPANIVYPVVGIIPNDFVPKCNPSEVEYAFYMPLKTFVEEGKVIRKPGIFRGKKVHYSELHYTHDKQTDRIFGFTCNYCIFLAAIIFGSLVAQYEGETFISANEIAGRLKQYFQFITSPVGAKL
ncbi:peroxisomal coenzyme a diphosphatase nudt7 [Plakobranchus ocellatus]|uniref:Peroxisomal coenzyme a diphosphatase nudt7 n=1 Tax=Plakobranchus ocellatus TaxID=259542 RepID=A0AAV4A8F7_9GAST|nr:peroxisomal coenzyme a diphosphatase nudt7 [Plakobranchus ocellatus]